MITSYFYICWRTHVPIQFWSKTATPACTHLQALANKRFCIREYKIHGFLYPRKEHTWYMNFFFFWVYFNIKTYPFFLTQLLFKNTHIRLFNLNYISLKFYFIVNFYYSPTLSLLLFGHTSREVLKNKFLCE